MLALSMKAAINEVLDLHDLMPAFEKGENFDVTIEHLPYFELGIKRQGCMVTIVGDKTWSYTLDSHGNWYRQDTEHTSVVSETEDYEMSEDRLEDLFEAYLDRHIDGFWTDEDYADFLQREFFVDWTEDYRERGVRAGTVRISKPR